MQKSPLVILGIDAGDPQLLEKWAADGTMPNLQRVMQNGCWGHTIGKELLFEHGAWLSVTSGISRRESAYHHYRQLKPRSYELELVNGADLDKPPFWSALRGAGKKVAIIDVPDSRPLPQLPGIQLSNWAVHDPQFPAVAHPPTLLEEVRQQFGEQILIHEQFENDLESDRLLFEQLMDRVQKKGALCRHLLDEDDYDLIFLVFAETHTGAHQFWKYRVDDRGPEKVPAPNPLMDAIRKIYQSVDRELGRLIDQLPEEANIFVVSSVGLKDHYPMGGLLRDFCFKLGYQVQPAPTTSPRSFMDLARRIIPESWRVAISKRLLSREARERLVSDQFTLGTDWARTTAFATPSTYMSFLWVNLRGRQPEGCVEPGQEYEELLHNLTEDLLQLIDPETEQRAVEQVWRSSELFDIDPLQSRLPDLLVEWVARPAFIQRLQHPKGVLEQMKPEFFRGSDHIRSGFVAAMGPAVSARGNIGELEVLDLAPTFLRLLGVDQTPAMTGRPIPQLARPESK